MSRVRVARMLLIATIVHAVVFYFAGSAIKPGYSQLSDFVSEYNATGTPAARVLTYAGFLVAASLSSAFLVAAAPLARVSGASRAGFRLLWCVPASYLLAVAFPCDAGCPAAGSASQSMHNVLATLAYFGIGAGLALSASAPGYRRCRLRRATLLATGLAFPVVFVAMIQPELAPWRGLLQRALDAGLACALVSIAWTLLPDTPAEAPRPRRSRTGTAP